VDYAQPGGKMGRRAMVGQRGFGRFDQARNAARFSNLESLTLLELAECDPYALRLWTLEQWLGMAWKKGFGAEAKVPKLCCVL